MISSEPEPEEEFEREMRYLDQTRKRLDKYGEIVREAAEPVTAASGTAAIAAASGFALYNAFVEKDFTTAEQAITTGVYTIGGGLLGFYRKLKIEGERRREEIEDIRDYQVETPDEEGWDYSPRNKEITIENEDGEETTILRNQEEDDPGWSGKI